MKYDRTTVPVVVVSQSHELSGGHQVLLSCLVTTLSVVLVVMIFLNDPIYEEK